MSRSEAVQGNEAKREEIKAQYKKFIGRKILFILSSLILTIIWHGLFQNPETTEELVVWSLRLPPILLGILAGIALMYLFSAMTGILGVLGPNGAGKSTLLKCIDRILAPSTTSIWLHDTRIE
ncbi:MAG: ATP-binding cassette domain-containing protein [Candidatus Methanospirareceae archaeon]